MGGSGGGSSGAISYPIYLMDHHHAWLDLLHSHMTSVAGENPYTNAIAYNPDTELSSMMAILALYTTDVTNYDPEDSWELFWDTVQTKLDSDVFSDTLINAKIAAYSASVLSRLSTNVLPKFNRGLQTIGASMTSAFTIGEALLTADSTRDINKYEADLKRDNEQNKINLINTTANKLLDATFNKITLFQQLSHYTTETNRIKIVAKNEEYDKTLEFVEKRALWRLEAYQYGANMLGSVSGGTTSQNRGVSKAQSVLGGAMSGAAMGTAIAGPGIGTAIGAVAGGIAGAL